MEENMYIKVLACLQLISLIFYLLFCTYYDFIYDKILMYSFKKPKMMGKQVFKACLFVCFKCIYLTVTQGG